MPQPRHACVTGLTAKIVMALACWGSFAEETIPHTRRADLLYVHIRVPAGYTVTFLSRQRASVAYKSPTTFGLKPGYGYWLRLEKPGEQETVFPLLEVLDTLSLPARVKASDLPATLTINELDLERVHAGEMVSKVVVVEQDVSLSGPVPRPGAAIPSPEDENEVMPPDDLLRHAAQFGRPLLILRLGNRQLQPHEWTQPPVPLTPELASWCRAQRSGDGQRSRNGAGFVRDGGDMGEPAHRTAEGVLGGVGPGDSVAEFTDGTRRKLSVAHPVHIAAPRFLTFYQITTLGRIRSELALQPVTSPLGREVVAQAENLASTRLQEDAQHLHTRTSLHAHRHNVPVIRVIGSQELGATRLEIPGTQVVSVPLKTEAVTWLGFDPSTDSSQPPLRLQKWASTNAARTGDMITFYLRYTNTSNRPLCDIAITDNLSPRLEYVPGSARSDREAVFVLQENEVGGRVLRWEIRDPLPPGHGGIITFQVRVR